MKSIPVIVFGRKHRKRSLRLQKKIEKKLGLKIKKLLHKAAFKSLAADFDGVSRSAGTCIMAKDLINQINQFLEKTKDIRNINGEFYSSFEPGLPLLETPNIQPGIIRWFSTPKGITFNGNNVFSIINC